MTLIAVGGTALTLLKAKASTLDVDFTIPGKEDYALFKKTLKSIPHDFRVDCYVGDLIFSEALPDD